MNVIAPSGCNINSTTAVENVGIYRIILAETGVISGSWNRYLHLQLTWEKVPDLTFESRVQGLPAGALGV